MMTAAMCSRGSRLLGNTTGMERTPIRIERATVVVISQQARGRPVFATPGGSFGLSTCRITPDLGY
jgi:hypothetical protein